MWLCLNVLLDAFDFKSVVREELLSVLCFQNRIYVLAGKGVKVYVW